MVNRMSIYLRFTIYYSLSFLHVFEQRVDSRRFLFYGVPHEVKRGSMPQIQRKAKLLAYIRRGVLQGPQSFLVLLLVTLDGEVTSGIAKVICHPNFGNPIMPQSRVF